MLLLLLLLRSSCCVCVHWVLFSMLYDHIMLPYIHITVFRYYIKYIIVGVVVVFSLLLVRSFVCYALVMCHSVCVRSGLGVDTFARVWTHSICTAKREENQTMAKYCYGAEENIISSGNTNAHSNGRWRAKQRKKPS